MIYSPRTELALTTMLEAHGLATRKAGSGFQASHVTSVAMIVHDFGFDEDTIVAALLHDTLEDTDLEPEIIRERFGDLVLATVRDVSEPASCVPWRERKLAYLAQIDQTPRDGARAIASADKIHNLSNMATGLDTRGHAFIRHFTAALEDMRWYHRAVLEILHERWQHPILDEQRRRLDDFEQAADRAAPDPRS
jgi:(p)ppGpp synthase/HD superfamily hydrolase